jgi:thiol-disulfide isomerase/thioredoxin
MLSKLREFDFYRKIPKDLTETSVHGSILSICAAIFMITLFVAELLAYLNIEYTSNVIVDPTVDAMLRINFNISVLDVPCEFAMIDVVDVLGTREDNVTKNINKWNLDANGLKRDYHGRNRVQDEIAHEDHHDLEQLHSNGIHAINIDEADFDGYLLSHKYAFVNFYAPWCIWCQRLEPVWEAFAEAVEREELPVSVIKVDCVKNFNLCQKQQIRAFPNLRFFKGSSPIMPDYSSDRSVDAFMNFAKGKINMDDQVRHMSPEQKERHEADTKEVPHPGCMLTGFLLVNRLYKTNIYVMT